MGLEAGEQTLSGLWKVFNGTELDDDTGPIGSCRDTDNQLVSLN